MKEQELTKKIAKVYIELDKLWLNSETRRFAIGSDYANQILTLIEEAGYMKLAKDQSLPNLNLPTLSGNRSLEVTMTSFAKSIQQNMIKAGFRKGERTNENK